MSYYCVATSVTRPTPSSVQVKYELHDDDAKPGAAAVMAGTMGVELLPSDAKSVATGVLMAPADRQQYAVYQVTQFFSALIARVAAGDADGDAVVKVLTGLKVKQA